jgi:hypothetical protein
MDECLTYTQSKHALVHSVARRARPLAVSADIDWNIHREAIIFQMRP